MSTEYFNDRYFETKAGNIINNIDVAKAYECYIGIEINPYDENSIDLAVKVLEGIKCEVTDTMTVEYLATHGHRIMAARMYYRNSGDCTSLRNAMDYVKSIEKVESGNE